MMKELIKKIKSKLGNFNNKQVLIDRSDLVRLLNYIEQLEEVQL